jgi:hypothetical protein
VKLWDWSKGFSSETNSKVELVLNIDVKKKVRTEPLFFCDYCDVLFFVFDYSYIQLITKYRNLYNKRVFVF